MDLEYAYRRLMTALAGIAAGKGLSDVVRVPGVGQSTKIFEALNDAVKYLDGPFHADHLDIVDQAFKKLGLVRQSDQISKVANAILKALTGVA